MRTGLGNTNGDRRSIVAAKGEEIGFIEVASEGQRLDVLWIELEAGHRGWGHGSEAVRLLEVEAARRGATSARAEVPVGNGLALYFWLRSGYRPDERAAGAAVGDRLTMVREIS
jgi:ribosomal protein S18 acetylase RimI-like enzyme